MPTVLRCIGLHKSFGNREVLKGVDLDVEAGHTVVIIGASGSGKSTLLRCFNFLELPTQGRIYLEDEPVGRLTAGGCGRVSAWFSSTSTCFRILLYCRM